MFNSIFKNEINTFLFSLNSYEKSTLRHYKEALHSFDEWLNENNLEEKFISSEIGNGWVKKISITNTKPTVYKKISIINRFLKFVYALGYEVNTLYVPNYKFKDNYIPYIFSDEEIKRILYYLDDKCQYLKYNRVYIPIGHLYSPLIIRIMIYCGTRLSETINIKVKAISFDNCTIFLDKTKNKKERYIVAHPSLIKMIKNHITHFKLSKDDYLFPGKNSDSSIGQTTVQKNFNEALLAVGIHKNTRKDHSRGPCLHCLRHYFVLKAFKQGVANGISVESQIPYLSYYLGHSSLNETEKYMKFSSELFPEEMEKFDDYSMDIFPEDI